MVRQAKSNMYSKIGQQKKDIITNLKGCKIYKDNPEINVIDFEKKFIIA